MLIWIGLVLFIWLASAGVIVYWFDKWSDRGQFGDLFGAVNSLFSGLAFAGVVTALLLQNHGLRLQLQEMSKEHDWNRRKAAHDLIAESSLGKFGDIRRKFESRIPIYDRDLTSATLNPPLSADEALQLDAVLNYLENVCLSIKNNVVDEDIVFDALSDILVAYWRWSKPYVNECRRTMSIDFWKDLEPYELKWRMRDDELKAATRAAGLGPGRPPL